MGRCLLYGAHAAPVGMACERKYVGPLDLVPLSSFPLNETSVHSSYQSPTGEKFSFVSLPILSDSMPEGIPGYVRYSGMCFRSGTVTLRSPSPVTDFKRRWTQPVPVYRLRDSTAVGRSSTRTTTVLQAPVKSSQIMPYLAAAFRVSTVG